MRQVSKLERYETWQICSIGGAAVHVGEQLLLFFGELELVEHLGVPGGNGDDVDVAPRPRMIWLQARVRRMPSRIRFSVEMLSVTTSSGSELLHHQLVFAAGPGEEVEQDLLHVVLDGGDQLLGLEGLQLDQDRAQPPPGADQLARLEVLAGA